MECTPLKLPNGGHAIVCTSGRRRLAKPCVVCGEPAHFLCDCPIVKGAGRDETCDAALCAHHAVELAPDVHYCHAHQRQTGARKSHLPLPTPILHQDLVLRGRTFRVLRLQGKKAHLAVGGGDRTHEVPLHRLRVLMREAGH